MIEVPDGLAVLAHADIIIVPAWTDADLSASAGLTDCREGLIGMARVQLAKVTAP